MLNQALNQSYIEGILSEVSIKTDVGKTSGKEYIIGEIKVRVDKEVDGEIVPNEVPVFVMAMKLTKKGTTNPSYESILKVKNEFTSLAAAGGDESKADIVRIRTGNIQENAFYTRDGNLVSYGRVSASFIERVTNRAEFKPAATFKNVIVVANTREETDKEGEVTGRLVVTGLIPQWGGKIDMVNFVVENPQAVDHIRNYYKKGDTVQVAGDINYSVKTIETKVEAGFGEPMIERRTVSTREFIIKSGSPQGFDDDKAYAADGVREAVQARMARLEESKNRAAQASKPSTPAPANKDSLNFGF